eukprot:jgi/Psemu1/207153/e_gw1.428.14.1
MHTQQHLHPRQRRRRRLPGAEAITGAATITTGRKVGPQRSRSFWTLSFSGAGHLLPYHLGVAKTLLLSSPETEDKESHTHTHTQCQQCLPGNRFQLPIRSVSGSSSGAIAATVTTLLPHRLDEYTDRFLHDRGHAFRNLRDMLAEETQTQTGPENASFENDNDNDNKNKNEQPASSHRPPVLSICTTRCSDGGIHLFSFEDCQREDHERLLKAIEASCRIPQSFHPLDMIVPNFDSLAQRLFVSSHNNSGSGNGRHTYPDAEGVEIDGDGFVDGGIAGPFPPTPHDGDPECTGRIVVSPISGEYCYASTPTTTPTIHPPRDGTCPISSTPPALFAVRPRDVSRKVPLVGSLTLSSQNSFASASASSDLHLQLQLRHEVPGVAVRARPSIQNLRAMITALGVVPNSGPSKQQQQQQQQQQGGDSLHSGGVLRDWFERGQEDAHELLRQQELPQQQ